jgi:glycosyltransferase involved in cell wall biosynthesis
MQIAIDIRDIAQHNGGIPQMFKPLIAEWIDQWSTDHFILVGPKFDHGFLGGAKNYSWTEIIPYNRLGTYQGIVFYDYYQLPRKLRKINADLFYSPYYDFWIPNCKKIIISVHDLCYLEVPEVFSAKSRYYYSAHLNRNIKRADYILTISETTKKKIIETYQISDEKIQVVYSSLNPEFSKEQKDQDLIKKLRRKFDLESKITFLYSSGVSARKNIPFMLRAFKEILRQGVDAKLLITGKETAKVQLEPLMRELGIQDQVVFTGFLSEKELKQCYYLAHACVFPSLDEGFGRAIIEAMSVGTPLVCSDIPVMNEIGENYPFYFNPKQVEDLADKMLQAVASTREPVLPKLFQLEENFRRFIGFFDSIRSI